MVKKCFKKVLQYIAILAGLVILYTVLLMAGQSIPRRLVINNARTSYSQMKKLGLYFEGVDGAEWDNWTDSYFVNSAVTEYEGNLLQRAMANAYTTFSELDDSGSANPIDDIRYAIEKDSKAVVKSYSRYWAGMLTVYKILLIFMPVNGIRTMVFGIVTILFAISVIGIYKLLGTKGVVPYLISVTIALYIPQAMCLVFNTDIVMMFLVMIICCVMLKRNASLDQFCLLFFLSGSILAYLNYWAFLLIALGFPLVLIVSARLIDGYDMKSLTKEGLFMSFSWGAGLVGTVLAKQILCRVVLGSQNGTEQLFLRMGSEFTLSMRLVAVVNGLVRRMTSVPVLVVTVVVTVWLVLMFKTGGFKRQYKCFLLIMIAFYPIIWWFLLPNHCIHGFVKHMYGVSYYALISAILINCQGLVPICSGVGCRNGIGKKIAVNVTVFVVWIVVTYGLFHVNIHYGTKKMEPWSLETVGTVNAGDGAVTTQEVHFEDFTMTTAYLKNVSTILVNLPDDKKDGILRVEILENGNMISASEVKIADITAGEWFQVPLGCIVALGKEYQVTYTVHENEQSEPYLLMQDYAQAVRLNDMLYIDGEPVGGALANKYEIDEFVLPVKAKIWIAFVILAIMEYGGFLIVQKIERESSGANIGLPKIRS